MKCWACLISFGVWGYPGFRSCFIGGSVGHLSLWYVDLVLKCDVWKLLNSCYNLCAGAVLNSVWMFYSLCCVLCRCLVCERARLPPNCYTCCLAIVEKYKTLMGQILVGEHNQTSCLGRVYGLTCFKAEDSRLQSQKRFEWTEVKRSIVFC